MTRKRAKKAAGAPQDPVHKELVRIRNLLLLDLMLKGLGSEAVDLAVQMGAAEIRRALPIRKIKKMAKKNGTVSVGET